MPPRIGLNGTIVKPSSSTKSQRTVRPTASKVIDLTRDSTDEISGNISGEEPAEKEDSEDAPGRHGEGPNGGRGLQQLSACTQGRTSLGAGQATIGRQKTDDHQRVLRRAQEG
ncbi:MAG: hypothetical protein ALECFALPRED_003413 [Alectoria fallacina]|uniref:Uncharacterized protein n=1 Tax=Alectoria fallacina TaxID=1903189 RepID=A0A8H3FHY9_9LECA|nr:MAG: hypothetical protein ALECFALPRED_003413 [Alectoria fallacina]